MCSEGSLFLALNNIKCSCHSFMFVSKSTAVKMTNCHYTKAGPKARRSTVTQHNA